MKQNYPIRQYYKSSIINFIDRNYNNVIIFLQQDEQLSKELNTYMNNNVIFEKHNE